MSSNSSGVGPKIRALRERTQITQRRLADGSGLTVSYLSRLENDHITPSVRTLRKIATALEVPLPLLFGDTEAVSEHCPVSLSGSCILEHRYSAETSLQELAGAGAETYSKDQLAVLQQCNDLLQHGDQALLSALERIVGALVLLQKAREKASKKATGSQGKSPTSLPTHGGHKPPGSAQGSAAKKA